MCFSLATVILLGSAQASTVIPFSSPENSYTALMDYLDSLNQSIYLSGYTFTSLDIADKLIEAKNKGLDVKILLEGGPVGGVSNFSKSILCGLYSNNISVSMYTGKLRFLHAKYMIGDSKSVLVSSENFGDGGYPKTGIGNRGWGALVFDFDISKKLSEIFFTDSRDSKEFVCDVNRANTANTGNKKSNYPIYKNQEVELVSAPENAVSGVIDILNSAQKSIYIEQLYIDDWDGNKNPFLEAAINKARQGVEVKILLDSSDFSLEGEESNTKMVEYINGVAKYGINIEAKLIDLESLGFREAHNKGIVIDNKKVFVSSVNWNENSPKNNREIGLLITGDAASYFSNLFLEDWGGSRLATTGKIIAESQAQVFYIVIFIGALCCVYYFAKHRPRKSKTFLS